MMVVRSSVVIENSKLSRCLEKIASAIPYVFGLEFGIGKMVGWGDWEL